jgi:murein DD-endopeptidase MepM/ murein hydrolase activator NlpD
MKTVIHLSFIAVIMLACCAAPALAEDVAPVPVDLALGFDSLVPGQFGTVIVSGWDVASASGTFDGRPVTFHHRGESLVALVAASLETEGPEQLLNVTINLHSGETINYHLPVAIAWAGYGNQTITIPSNLGYLLEPDVNDNETLLLNQIYGQSTPQRFWDGALETPIPVSEGAITSPFGVYRVYNDGKYAALHSGQDIAAPVGTQVKAAAPGRVVLAEALDVRGNMVIIDHGWGVFTGYCHFSEILVEAGQMVNTGDVVGKVGNTGRSTGAHLHWELAVGGTWVDPLEWAAPAMP